MLEPKPFAFEEQRVEAVRSTGLVDTPLEERFERITRMVCKLLDVPIAIFNLLDDEKQYYKSVQGLPGPDAPLQAAFCTHTLREKEMLLVPDTSKDERFHDNPFVKGQLFVGFYAGCPVRTPNGMPVGSLCAIDTKPRNLSPEQLATLRDLAALVENEIKVSKLSQVQKDFLGDLDDAERLEYLDPVTRLWNHDGALKILRGHGLPLTVILVGIDNIKQVNTLLGRQVVEGIQRSVAKKLVQALSPDDIVCRYLSNDFMVILPDSEDRAVIEKAAAQVNALLHEDSFIAGIAKKISVSLSFGISGATAHDKDTFAVLARAQKALEAAQSAGAAQVKFAA